MNLEMEGQIFMLPVSLLFIMFLTFRPRFPVTSGQITDDMKLTPLLGEASEKSVRKPSQTAPLKKSTFRLFQLND